MSVHDSSLGAAALSGASEGRAVTNTPSPWERWFVYIALLATAIIPGIENKYGASDTLNQIFWSLAYAIALRQLLRMRTQAAPLVRRSAVLWALPTLMLASALWSLNPSKTAIEAIELFGTTIVGLYIVVRFTLKQFISIVTLFFGTVASLSLLMVFLAPGHGRVDWGAGAWQGIYVEKNTLAAAASLALISQIVLLPSVKGRGRALLLAGIVLSGVLLLGAKSATSFAATIIIVAGALIILACRSPKFGGFARFATILGAVIVIGSIFAFGLTPDVVYSALGRSSDLDTRADFWPYLQQAIADRPLLGFGYNAFFQSQVSDDYLTAFVAEAGGWSPYHAHNSFLQTELDAGYFGLAALVLLLVSSIWRAILYFARERSSLAIWPLSIILFLTIGSFTETYYLNVNSLEWILFVTAILYPLQSLLQARTPR